MIRQAEIIKGQLLTKNETVKSMEEVAEEKIQSNIGKLIIKKEDVIGISRTRIKKNALVVA